MMILSSAFKIGTLLLRAENGRLSALVTRQDTLSGAVKKAPSPYSARDAAVIDKTLYLLEAYFQGKDPDFSAIPLDMRGSAFDMEVWRRLLMIPYGDTVTYGLIARELALKRGIPRMAAQAVGGAVGRNPISIIVPCHRVIGSGGRLTGYSGGLYVKAKLLRLEGHVISPDNKLIT